MSVEFEREGPETVEHDTPGVKVPRHSSRRRFRTISTRDSLVNPPISHDFACTLYNIGCPYLGGQASVGNGVGDVVGVGVGDDVGAAVAVLGGVRLRR